MSNKLEDIIKKRDGKSKLSLNRINKLLEFLDNPQDKLKVIHVAGTNGKGSVVTTTSNILIKAGYKVGKYISPYIDNFYESIQINNEYISEKDMKILYKKIERYIEKMEDKPTSFEIIAAIAFEYFYENDCDIVCLEVGLGGRFDATNCIKNTIVSVITKIDYDHMEYLGNNIEEIAFEKCGIIKENKVTVSYPIQKEAAMKMIKTVADTRCNKLVIPDLSKLESIKKEDFNYSFKYKGKEYVLGLNGKYQIDNTIVTIEIIEELNKQGFKINYESIFQAIKNTKLIGRLDIVKEKPIVMLDGAHNLGAAKVLKEFIEENKVNRNIVLVIGMIEGKNPEEFFKELSGLASKIFITKINDAVKKSIDLDLLAEAARKYNKDVEAIENQALAIEKATETSNEDDIVIVTGSLYLVSEVYKLF